MTTRLCISFLGPFQVTLDGEPVTQFGSDTARALLAYLALHPGVPHRRDALAGLLWPEHTDARARHNLRAALSRLRTALQDRETDAPLLHVERQTIEFSFDAHGVVDVLAMRDALSATRSHAHDRLDRCDACADTLHQVADLYRGEFLAGFSLDSAPFEEWMVVEREGWHWQALEALSALAAYHEGQGDYDRAIACARRQVELEPWREGAHRQWMRCLAASGHRAAALAQYETCKRILAEELGVEPETETQALYERIRSGALAPAPPPTSVPQGIPVPEPAPASRVVPTATPLAPGLQTAELEDERRAVTALSVGLAGQDRTGDPELWAEGVGQVLRQAASIVARYGGEIGQVRGDGLVALFGAAAAHEDDPPRAILAALGIAEAAPGADLEIELQVRVGVCTGEAVVTRLGGGLQQAVTALGSVVPAAGQLERAAEPGTVLVDEESFRLAEPFFEWTPAAELPGLPGPAFRPLARAAAGDALRGKGRGIPGLDAPLIGRDAEVRALQQALDNLRAGSGGMVTLVGEAGIGKSRLVAEIRKSVRLKSPTLQWIEGRCLSYTSTVAYQLWLDVLRGLLGVEIEIEGSLSADAACVSLREQIRALCSERTDEVHPYLARLTCTFLDEEAEDRLSGLDAQGLRYLTFRAWEIALECALQQQAVTLVCEDLHWADPTSLALLEYLLPLIERLPLLLVCVFRPLTDHGCWHVREVSARDHRQRHTDLWLEPLNERESGELVSHLLRIEDLPETLRARIIGHADGNPFYVEEILRSLIDGGVLDHHEAEGRWRATQDLDEIPLPDTLRGVLMARIDRLPAAARRVLQLASVVGRFFERRVLESLVQDSRDLEDDLRALQQAQMIRERASPAQATYIFKHQLTVEAAYESLLRRKRRALHRRVAQALERLYPERVEEQLGVLARHWERAGEIGQAVDYLWRAGEQAAAQFANVEAVGYFSRALDLAPEGDLAGRYALTTARESALDLLGRREPQQADLVALESLGEALADLVLQADVALRWTHYSIRVREFEAAERAARTALRWAEMAGDRGREAAAHCELGRTLRYLYYSGQLPLEPALTELRRALQIARSVGLQMVEADTLHELGAIEPDRDLSRAYFEEQLRVCRKAGYRSGEGRALRDMGLSLLHRYQVLSAIDDFAQSLRVCREAGNRREEGWALQYLSLAHNTIGDYAAARRYGEQALRVHREVNDYTGEAEVTRILIQSAVRMGDSAAGIEIIAQFEPHQNLDWDWILFVDDWAWRRGDIEVAQAEYERVVQHRGSEGFRVCVAQCGLAGMAFAAGDRIEAKRRIDLALPDLEEQDWFSFRVGLYPHLVCYRVLNAVQDPRAQEVLEKAYRLLQERASWIEDEALRRSYLENVPANREIAALYGQAT